MFGSCHNRDLGLNGDVGEVVSSVCLSVFRKVIFVYTFSEGGNELVTVDATAACPLFQMNHCRDIL